MTSWIGYPTRTSLAYLCSTLGSSLPTAGAPRQAPAKSNGRETAWVMIDLIPLPFLQWRTQRRHPLPPCAASIAVAPRLPLTSAPPFPFTYLVSSMAIDATSTRRKGPASSPWAPRVAAVSYPPTPPHPLHSRPASSALSGSMRISRDKTLLMQASHASSRPRIPSLSSTCS
ncbi:hypothetical protein C8R44DRAFT_878827 [Mycena epipterygia]|nr:hypothetical protein C8R44DRAFT_878827 [Mycena epipterygia]